jgi:Zn-dependent oligopeptidase
MPDGNGGAMARSSAPKGQKHERRLAYIAAVGAVIAAIMSTTGTVYTAVSAGKQSEASDRRKERTDAYSQYLNAVSDLIFVYAKAEACASSRAVEQENLSAAAKAAQNFIHSGARIDLVGTPQVRDKIDAISIAALNSNLFAFKFRNPVSDEKGWRCNPIIVDQKKMGELVAASRSAIDLGREQLGFNKTR